MCFVGLCRESVPGDERNGQYKVYQCPQASEVYQYKNIRVKETLVHFVSVVV